jgi:hypothetical protein
METSHSPGPIPLPSREMQPLYCSRNPHSLLLVMLHPILGDNIDPGYSVSPRETSLLGETTLSLLGGSISSSRETTLLGEPTISPPRGSFCPQASPTFPRNPTFSSLEVLSAPLREPSLRNMPSPHQEVHSTPWEKHSLPKCPRAHPNFWLLP